MSTLSLIGFSPQPPLSGGGVTHSFRLRSDELEPLRGPFSRSRKPVDNSVRIYVPGRAASRAAYHQTAPDHRECPPWERGHPARRVPHPNGAVST